MLVSRFTCVDFSPAIAAVLNSETCALVNTPTAAALRPETPPLVKPATLVVSALMSAEFN